jgi:phosphopantetheine binding protein
MMPGNPSSPDAAAVWARLMAMIASRLGVTPGRLDPHAHFSRLGADPRTMTAVLAELSPRLSIPRYWFAGDVFRHANRRNHFFELGMDSMMVTRLRLELQRDVGRTLPGPSRLRSSIVGVAAVEPTDQEAQS